MTVGPCLSSCHSVRVVSRARERPARTAAAAASVQHRRRRTHSCLQVASRGAACTCAAAPLQTQLQLLEVAELPAASSLDGDDGFSPYNAHPLPCATAVRDGGGSAPLTPARVWLPEKQLWVPVAIAPGAAVVMQGAVAAPAPAGVRTAPVLQRVYMASSATRGQRSHMEDAHVLAALHPTLGVQPPTDDGVALARAVSMGAVFDGHSGAATAALAARHMPSLLHQALSGRPGSGDGPRVPVRDLLPPHLALEAGFTWFDRWWADARCDPDLTAHGWDDSGATAVVALVAGSNLIVANAGDSAAVLASGGAAVRLSVPHRLDNAAEASRVLAAGGRLVSARPGGVPRVMGSSSNTRFRGSMVTRALGDFSFKHPQPLLSATPHIASVALCPGDALALLTSDGVSEVLPDADALCAALDAVNRAREHTSVGTALATAAAAAVKDAALAAGSTDNITVVALLFDWDGTLTSSDGTLTSIDGTLTSRDST